MCMSLEALALFLNIIDPDIVSSEPGFITVHATEGDVVYVEQDENWCTAGNDRDQMIKTGH